GEPDPGEQLAGLGLDVLTASPLRGDGRLDDVLERGEVREQVEALEDEPDLGALPEDLALLELAQGAALAAVPDELAVDGDEALVDLLQVVDRAQERRLARAGRAEHDRHGPGPDGERHAAQHLERAEALVDAVDLDEPGGRGG